MPLICDGESRDMVKFDVLIVAMPKLNRQYGIVPSRVLSAHLKYRGISLAGKALTEMDSATQQNAALVQESVTAAASLQEQAQHPTFSISSFNLPQGIS